MKKTEMLYVIVKQLPMATAIQTEYGAVELDDELRRAVESALTPILEGRTGTVIEKQASPVQKFAEEIQKCMEPIAAECLCLDEKEDNDTPQEHDDYCPVYLYDYLGRAAVKSTRY